MTSLMKTVDISIPVPFGLISGRIFGNEGGKPVLCVHGRSDNLETFTNLIPLLPRDYRYVCIDLPGHGKSAKAEKGYILDLIWYTLCVKRVIDHFGWKELYFLGHSLGGQIGFTLAAVYPESVVKLVVIDSLIAVTTPPENTARAMRQDLFDPTLKLEQRYSLDHAPTYSLSEFVRKMKEVRGTEVRDDQIRAMAERNLVRVGLDQYKYSNDQRTKIFGPSYFTVDQLESLANNVSCPTLVIFGKQSLTTKPLHKLRHSPLHKVGNVEFHIIDGDHDVHLARPQEVAQLVYFFLNGRGQSKL